MTKNELKESIIEYFSKSDYTPLGIDALAKVFNDDNLDEAIKELEDEFIIRKSKKGHYDLLAKNNIGVGIIEIKDKGYGFIKDLNSSYTFYVDKVDRKNAFSGDTVLFAKYKYIDYGDNEKPEAKVIEVLKRGLSKIVGEVYSTKKGKLNFKANLANTLFEVSDFKDAKKGDLAVFSIDKYGNNLLYGHIDSVIGKVDDSDAMYKELCFKYDFHYDFDQDVLNEANAIEFGDSNRQFIDKLIFTIDGDDAKDFDDAVSIEKLANGNYLLGVYIADVANYVVEDSLIDKEAFFRGTSVYLPNKVIPMLPEKLSNDLCSLRENENKKVIACLMEINNRGIVDSYDLKEAIIKSSHRMTYNDVNDIIKNDEILNQKYQDIRKSIFMMNELKDILHQKRVRRGSLDFEANESVIIYDGDKIKDIKIRERGEAENLIEEFMLIANETVASHIYHMDLPFIYRIHEEPPLANYKKLIELLNGLGIKTHANLHHISNFDLQKVLELTSDTPSVQYLVLRLMCKAKYSEVNVGHFGLASPIYTHFTSPIRRYPDLIVHRLIHKYIFNHELDTATLKKMSEVCNKASIQSSKKEKDAISFEYEANDKVIAKYYENLIGYEFMGTISSVTNFGLFITLDNLVEGMVHISKLPGYYVYNEQTCSLIETSPRHRKYSLGQRVKVIVNGANATTGQIDFIIVK